MKGRNGKDFFILFKRETLGIDTEKTKARQVEIQPQIHS